MEYVRTMDDLMLQINGCTPNEAVMRVFNILFPYDKPLPLGKGDELTISSFYDGPEGNKTDEDNMERLRKSLDKAVHTEPNVLDLQELQQQIAALLQSNHLLLS